MTLNTNGPWTAEPDAFWAANIYDDGNQFCPISKQPMGGKLLIASVAWRRDKEEAQANARVIAAAPDLLESLIWLLNYVDFERRKGGHLAHITEGSCDATGFRLCRESIEKARPQS